jgi:hypothetical protein
MRFWVRRKLQKPSVYSKSEVRLGPGGEDEVADALGLDQYPQALRQGVVERVRLMDVYRQGSRNGRNTVCQSSLG